MDVYRLETVRGVVRRHWFRKVYGYWWKLTEPRSGRLLDVSDRTWACAVDAEIDARRAWADSRETIVFYSYTGTSGFFGAHEPVTL